LLQDIGGVAATGSAWFDFSRNGTFLYRIGSAIGGAALSAGWMLPGSADPCWRSLATTIHLVFRLMARASRCWMWKQKGLIFTFMI
jgi:hypothetical protein